MQGHAIAPARASIEPVQDLWCMVYGVWCYEAKSLVRGHCRDCLRSYLHF